MKKRKLNYKNIVIALLFLTSTGILVVGGIWLAWSIRCLTFKGVIFTIAMLTVSGMTGDYLNEEMQ